MESLSRTKSAPWDFLRVDRIRNDGRRVGHASVMYPAVRELADATCELLCVAFPSGLPRGSGEIAEAQAGDSPAYLS